MNTDRFGTNENDIYLFFEVIHQSSPKRVLDVGLFAQRIGMISRQAMNCEIPTGTELTGWNILNLSILPVYETIYDEIKNSVSKPDASYDLIFLLHVNEFLNQADKVSLWELLISHGKSIIADASDSHFLSYMTQRCSLESVQLEQQQYVFIRTPDHSTS